MSPPRPTGNAALSLLGLLLLSSSRTTPALAQDATPPVIHVEHSIPEPDRILDPSSPFVFAVRASDDSGSIKNVKFSFRDASGSVSTRGGTRDDELSADGHEVWYVSETFAEDGKWSWKAKATDYAKNGASTDWSDFFVVGGYPGVVSVARSMIADLIASSISLAPKFVRLGFHDCVGGCDGCVDMSEPDNAGLDVPIDALQPVVDLLTYTSAAPQFSRADVWALAALVGAEMTQNELAFPMNYVGRADCSPAGAKSGPTRHLPHHSNITTSSLMHFFSREFGFGPRETVAIMGAHSIGTAKRTISGFDGPDGWTFNKDKLSVGYYELIVGGNGHSSLDGLTDEDIFFTTKWTQETIDNRNKGTPDRVQWFHLKDANKTNPVNPGEKRQERPIMLNADIALVRDFDGYLNGGTGEVGCQFRCCPDKEVPVCPAANLTMWIAAEFKFNNTMWLGEFRDAFDKMLMNRYVASSPSCDAGEVPCVLEPSSSSSAARLLRGQD